MSKRRNKQNRISVLLDKKPEKCVYEKVGNMQRLYAIDANAVDCVEKTALEELCKNPNDLFAKGKLAALKSVGLLTKESLEAATSKDSN
ncbi:hypothetical protein [Anaerosporobacter sp.]|uniref:hypothetical protein n=1 Tax=Anaerosporobacter sp. TaxID=1872529 RepID=UPI00286F304C|nr:hypothetical protein [Anaerosporobacter sp.]